MKITNSHLRKIINEELEAILDEALPRSRPPNGAAESEQDAWHAGGSDLYEKGKADAQAGFYTWESDVDDNSHGHYAKGYRAGRKK